MKRVEKIWLELAKEQKVELRDIIGDLNSLTKEMNRHKSESASKAQAIINDVKRLYNILVDLNEAANKLEGLAEYAVEGFAEVGIQPPREVARAMDESGATKKAVTSGVKTLKNAMNNIQNAVRRL
jgi:methyl-accepting chemotaxis protein